MAVELLPGRERPRIGPVDEEDAVEVIDLVLEGAGRQPALDLLVLLARRDRDSGPGRRGGAARLPRRSGTERQPSLISTISSPSGSMVGLIITVSGTGGLYG